MNKMFRKLLALVIVFLCSLNSYGNTIESLKTNINTILESKKAMVGVSILGLNAEHLLSINGDAPLPMQSVFKYHLAVAVLNQVDQGKLSLEDKITITPQDLDNGLWSPIRKKYPEGGELTLAEIIKYTVAVSDNVGCDILFRMLGGPKVVEEYFHQSGIKDIAINYDEITQQMVWERQYENWTTANAANMALSMFFKNESQLLSPESHRFLWNVMKSSKTGGKTIKAGLPEGTPIAHKTGHSGKNDEGLSGAQNDIGVVFFPDGSHYFLSILISDSLESSEVNKGIISDIANLTWQFFEGSTKN